MRADLQGGALASDCGARLLRGLARQIGRTARLAAAMRAQRHPSSIAHPVRDLLAQRGSPLASGDAEATEAHRLRPAPLFKWGRERLPRAAAHDLASAPTCSRLAHRGDRTDLSRLTRALVDQCLASDVAPPAASVLALAHPDAPPHGQQALAFSHHDSRRDCSLPRCRFAGPSGALVMAGLRPGTRPTGVENARRLARLLAPRRPQGPAPPLRSRGESHGAPPEVLDTLARVPGTECVCGLAATAVLLRQAAAVLADARPRHGPRTAVAQAHGEPPAPRRRRDEACAAAAASGAQAWRVMCPAAVLPAGATPRLVLTALTAPAPPLLSEDLYGARGPGENMRKAAKCARHRDRPAATPCLATALRWLRAGAASGLPPALRPPPLRHTTWAPAQPATVLLPLCTVAPLGSQSKERRRLPRPRSCPVNGLLQRVTAGLDAVPVLVVHPS